MAATTTPTENRKRQARAGGERRGNTRDRAARRANLLRHWGDGETCVCVYCGRTLRNHSADMLRDGGAMPTDHVEADKILPHESGPGYRMANLIPGCRGCNLSRSDRPLAEVVGADRAAILIAHAATYRPNRGR